MRFQKMMGKIVAVLAVLVLAGVLLNPGCQNSEEVVSREGRLVYIISNRVEERDLASGKTTVLYRYPGIYLDPSTLVKIDKETFIIADESARGMYLLVNGKTQALGKGYGPVYFPKHEVLLYLKKEIRKNPQIPAWEQRSITYLYEAKFQENQLASQRKLLEPLLGGSSPFYPLALSDDELLVERLDGTYAKYDIRTGQLMDIPMRVKRQECRIDTWRSKTQEFICFKSTRVKGKRWSNDEYFRVDMEGNWTSTGLRYAVFKEDENWLVFLRSRLRKRIYFKRVYMPETDSALVRTAFSDFGSPDILVYDFATGTTKLLAEEVPAYGNSVLWLPPTAQD